MDIRVYAATSGRSTNVIKSITIGELVFIQSVKGSANAI